MEKVFFDLSMSLDGFIAGPNDEIDPLHDWLYGLASWREPHGLAGGETNRDAEVLDESWKSTGAIVMGRRWFDVGEGPWGDDPPFRMPCFVLTHEARERLVKGATTFTFVTEGIESALEQAKTAAGDKDVAVGGANVAQQCIEAGLLDEMQLHLVPVLLGEGIRLFEHLGSEHIEPERTRVIESPAVTHLTYRVANKRHTGARRAV
jgi:dihydrofolate reductase